MNENEFIHSKKYVYGYLQMPYGSSINEPLSLGHESNSNTPTFSLLVKTNGHCEKTQKTNIIQLIHMKKGLFWTYFIGG